jgi:glucosamine kinase
MILIADSGSTKTDWRVITNKGQVEQAKSAGFNPYYQSTENIFKELQDVLMPQVTTEVEEIYYYGAGCSNEDKCGIVESALKMAFPSAIKIEVNHDLLAAARALCNNEKGIACILGTGSNSCLYDGEKIIANKPSLGFMLGDEGSGAILGKKIVVDFLNRDLPSHLHDKFEKRYKTNKDEILDHVYKQPFPNRYLAKFSQFLFHNLSDPYIYKLVYRSFEEFFEKNVFKYDHYKDEKIHFVGSVAFYYGNILRQVANDKGLHVKNILETPIAGLTLYHLIQLKN